MRSMNSSSGMFRAASRSAVMRRPSNHVVSPMSSRTPTSSGNQPPAGIFGMLAARKPRSTVRNNPVSDAALVKDHSQRCRATE